VKCLTYVKDQSFWNPSNWSVIIDIHQNPSFMFIVYSSSANAVMYKVMGEYSPREKVSLSLWYGLRSIHGKVIHSICTFCIIIVLLNG